EGVVAGAEGGDVVALVAVDRVVAVAADQPVVPVATEDRVVPRAAVHCDPDQGGQVAGSREVVVTAVHVHDQVLGGADVDRERPRVDAVEADARPVGGGGELLGPGAAVDLDRIDAVAALVEVGPGTRVPDHPVATRL